MLQNKFYVTGTWEWLVLVCMVQQSDVQVASDPSPPPRAKLRKCVACHCLCACVRACVRTSVRTCVRACVRVCARLCACVCVRACNNLHCKNEIVISFNLNLIYNFYTWPVVLLYLFVNVL